MTPSGEIYYAQLVDEESTETVMAALREVVGEKGIFCSLYSDRASHFWTTPVAGDVVDRQQLTQVGRALAELGIEMIPAYSPQARGRCERSYGTWQGRLPQELRLAGITTLEEANRFLREHYIAEFNRRFAKKPTLSGNAFCAVGERDLDLIFSLQWERVVARDNTVRIANRILQINKTKWWNTLAGCRVKVHQHLDGRLSIKYGGHVVGQYTPDGVPIEAPEANRKSTAKKKQPKRAMEAAASRKLVEKPKNGFPTSSLNAWKTRSKKHSEFPTPPTAPAVRDI